MADASALAEVSKSLQHLLRSVIADRADFLGVPPRLDSLGAHLEPLPGLPDQIASASVPRRPRTTVPHSSASAGRRRFKSGAALSRSVVRTWGQTTCT